MGVEFADVGEGVVGGALDVLVNRSLRLTQR